MNALNYQEAQDRIIRTLAEGDEDVSILYGKAVCIIEGYADYISPDETGMLVLMTISILRRFH